MRRRQGVWVVLGIIWMLAACVAGSLLAGTPLEEKPMPASTLADEGEMVYIPAGEFEMGQQEGMDTRPMHRVFLPAFFIDTYEVTNKRYKRFIDATTHKVPWSQDPAAAPYAWEWQTRMFPRGKGEDPVVLVSWEDAKAFCLWAGKALPTEAQWEKAARGARGKIYPWGDVWLPGKANTWESSLRETAPSGVFEGDVSEYGVHDLAGNVSEWVEDWFAPYPGNSIVNYDAGEKYKVLRGGSWDYFHSIATGYHRQYAIPHSQMTAIGFRCVRPASEPGGTPSEPKAR